MVGHRALGRAIQDTAPELRVEGDLVWDPRRHEVPESWAVVGDLRHDGYRTSESAVVS